MDKKEFTAKVGELLTIAKPHLIKTEYMIGHEIENIKEWDRIVSGGEYAVVTCENRHRYFIDITANSLNAIASAIFDAMANK